MTTNINFFLGLTMEKDTSQEWRKMRDEGGCDEIMAPFRPEGAAQLWEKERDNCNADYCHRSIGYGVAYRAQSVARTVMTTPEKLTLITVATCCTGLSCLPATVLCPCEVEQKEHRLCDTTVYRLGETVTRVIGLARMYVCLPFEVAIPECLNIFGYQQYLLQEKKTIDAYEKAATKALDKAEIK